MKRDIKVTYKLWNMKCLLIAYGFAIAVNITRTR